MTYGYHDRFVDYPDDADRERVGRVGQAAHVIAKHIEEIVGEMSSVQIAKVVGAVLGFWCAEEDEGHPRADGRSWKDIVREELEA